MGVSLLAHLLVFFSPEFFIDEKISVAKIGKAGILEVRINWPLTKHEKLLTTTTPAAFKITQPKIKKNQDSVPHSSPSVVTGVKFPGAASTRWPGQISSLFGTGASRSAQTYYQQTMEAQARQQSEQRAQIIMQQLQQMLGTRLNIYPAVTGKCVLAETGVANNHLVCDSQAMSDLLRTDENRVVGMLLALRGMGKTLNGFSAKTRAEGLGIILINEE